MSAAESQDPFTEEDVRLVAWTVWNACFDEGKAPGEPSATCEVDARLVLRALAEAGRLVPAGGEVTEDRGYRRKHRAGDGYTPTLLAGHRPASWQEGAQEMRRTTRRWPDGSQWIGPWRPVEDGAP